LEILTPPCAAAQLGYGLLLLGSGVLCYSVFNFVQYGGGGGNFPLGMLMPVSFLWWVPENPSK
jgi:hypothetical protein